MSAPSSPAQIIASTGHGPVRRHQAGYADQRVSDAERAEIADELSRHYADGRLDEDEFNQRLSQAMNAKTYQDLGGLLQDLPPGPGAQQPPRPPQRTRPRSSLSRLAVFVLLAIVLLVSFRAVSWVLAPVLWIWILVAIGLLVARRRRNRRI